MAYLKWLFNLNLIRCSRERKMYSYRDDADLYDFEYSQIILKELFAS